MSFWDKVAGIYDITESLNRNVYNAMLRGVRQIVPEGAMVLDCAAGTGELSIAASDFTAETYSKMLNGCRLGPVKVTFVDGLIPLAFGVMKKV